MKAQITVKSIPTFKPQAKPYEVTDKGLVLRVQPSGVATFYAVYRVSGKNQRYRIGNAGQFKQTDEGRFTFQPGIHPETARKVLKDKSNDAAKGKDPQAELKAKRAEEKSAKTRTVGGFFEHQYAPWLLTERKSGKATVKRMNSCFSWLFNKPMTEVTPFLLQAWRKKQREAGKSPHTINRDTSALKHLLSKAVEWDFLTVHPLAKLKPAKADDNARVRYLSAEEERRLFDALDTREAKGRADRLKYNEWRRLRHKEPLPELTEKQYIDHLKPIVLLALNTGMRRGEIFSLEWRDIDFNHKRLTVRAAAAKGAKTRHIPLNATSLKVLKRWQEQTDGTGLVFPGHKGARLDNITTSWGNLVKSAEIDDFKFHDLRHDFATKALKAGADIVTLSKLLGHANLKMTLRYSHVTDEALAAAVDRLPANG